MRPTAHRAKGEGFTPTLPLRQHTPCPWEWVGHSAMRRSHKVTHDTRGLSRGKKILPEGTVDFFSAINYIFEPEMKSLLGKGWKNLLQTQEKNALLPLPIQAGPWPPRIVRGLPEWGLGSSPSP